MPDTFSLHLRIACAVVSAVVTMSWASIAFASGDAAQASVMKASAKTSIETLGDSAFKFVVGDRLSIRLYERYVGNAATGEVSSLIEYPEVSGEYVVLEDGTIHLPLIGSIKFSDMTQHDLIKGVARLFEGRHGRPVEVVVRVVDRDPVYVTGSVTRPGAYEYVPAMTPAHALALAGGLLGSDANIWQRLDLGRERERLRMTELTLARLTARRAVLEAEDADREPVPPADLVALVGRDRAERLLEKAAEMRMLERNRAVAEDKAHQAFIDRLEKELTITLAATAEAEHSVMLRKQRVEEVTRLQREGLANEATFNIANDSLINARESGHQMRRAVAQLQSTLVEARNVRERLLRDDMFERQREKATLKTQTDDHEATVRAIRQMLLIAEKSPAATAMRHPKIVVLRRAADGLTRMTLDKHAMLRPGDLIEITDDDAEHAQFVPQSN